MSGGIAYILDEDKAFESHCNKSMVELEKLPDLQNSKKHTAKELQTDLLDFDVSRLKLIINRHLKYTKSPKAKLIIDNWDKYLPLFLKITPYEFKRALNERKQRLLINKNLPIKIAGE
jgi:glutamate synthase (NADPH/NADH) large chain